MPFPVRTALPVWVAALLGVAAVAVYATPAGRPGLIAIVLAGCIVLTFLLQLAIVRKEGIVTRMMVSIGGTIVLLGIATLVFRLAGVAGI